MKNKMKLRRKILFTNQKQYMMKKNSRYEIKINFNSDKKDLKKAIKLIRFLIQYFIANVVYRIHSLKRVPKVIMARLKINFNCLEVFFITKMSSKY